MDGSTTVIEIVAQVTDETASGAHSAEANVSKLEKSMMKLQRQIQSMKGKSKLEVMTTLKDMASKGIQGVWNSGKKIAGKVFTVTLKAVDLVTAPFKKVLGLIANPVVSAAAFAGISFGLADTISTFKDFEQEMANVKAISGATGEEFEALKSTAKQLGESTMFSAAQAAEAMENLAMAGWKSKDIVAGMPGLLDLAAAGSVDLATAADVTASALAQFKMEAGEAGRAADVLAATATNSKTDVAGLGESLRYAGSLTGALGYSIEDVSVALGIMGNAAIDGSSAGIALRATLARMSKQEGLTADESNAVADAMRKLGVSMTDSNGKSKGLMTIMKDMRTGYAKLSEAEQTATMTNLAGQNALSGMLAIVQASDEDFDKLTKAINNSSGAAAEMAGIKMDTLQGSLYYLQSAAEGVKIAISEKLQPYVKGLVDWTTAHMPDIQNAAGKAADYVTGKIDDVTASIKEMTHSPEWQNAETLWDKVKVAWDKLIAEPFSSWWNGTGKAWLADKANAIGEGIGTALKTGILTLLGVNIDEAAAEGTSIGKSFSQGIADGFDASTVGKAVLDAFKDVMKRLVSDAAKLIPGGESARLSSMISAMVLGKAGASALNMVSSLRQVGKLLFGSQAVQQADGTAAVVPGILRTLAGSANEMTGLAGFGVNAAIKLGAGNLAGGASLSAGALSGLGLGAAAGGTIGGYSLIKGAADLYKGVKSDNQEEAAAYKKAGAWEIGGVGAGAAAGAAIGSIIPGLGTAVGGLIGAGIGGLIGLYKGSKTKKAYEKETAEAAEEAQKAALKQQKALAATGRSLEDVKFKSEALNEAINDAGVSAENFGAMFREAVADDLQSHFGDITLSMQEIGRLANEIAFEGQEEQMFGFAAAVQTSERSLETLQARMRTINRLNWEAELGIALSEQDVANYKSAMDGFASETAAYLKDKNYEADIAVRLLAGDENGIVGVIDSAYAGLQEQLDNAASELQRAVEETLSDGVISAKDKITVAIGGVEYEMDEAAAITELQNQIAEITNKVSAAEGEAKLQSLKIRYGGAQMDAESFAALQTELQANVSSMTDSYTQALEIGITHLNLELSEGAIDQVQYDAQLKELTEGYNATIQDLQVRVESFQLDTIAEAYSAELDAIFPDIEMTTQEKLQTAMNNALKLEPDPMQWTAEDVSRWFNLGELDTETQTAIAGLLQQTATAIPKNMASAISSADFDIVGSAAAAGVGNAIASTDMEPIKSSVDTLLSNTTEAVNDAFSAGVNTTMPVNVTMDYSVLNPTKTFTVSGGGMQGTKSVTVGVHGDGGIMTNPHLGLVAEDGAEAIIPLSGKRRERGLSIWEKTGEMLGVKPYADGAIVGNASSAPIADGNGGIESVANKAPKSGGGITDAPDGEPKPDGGNGVDKNPPPPPENNPAPPEWDPPTPKGNPSPASGGITVPVTIENLTLEINISGGEVPDAQALVEVIRENVRGMTDEIAYQLAAALMQSFANTPREQWR